MIVETQGMTARFEQFPYPHRDPQDESQRLCATGLDDLGAVNHYCFGGRKNIRRGFRVLVAGGGTGDAVVYLAHQLRETNAKIVYFDLSPAACDIAQQRAAKRGLKHRIEWRTDNVLDLPDMEFEPFDYVNCVNLLEYLPDAAAGLQALRSVMKDDGAIGLRVPAPYGRQGVAMLQQLLQILNPGDADERQLVETVQQLVNALPATNPFKLFGGVDCSSEGEIVHHLLSSDARTFSMPQLYDCLEAANLHLAEFAPQQRMLYSMSTFDGLIAAQSPPSQMAAHAAAELMHGTIQHHTFWATAREISTPQWDDPENVPFYSHFSRLHGVRESILNTPGDEWKLTFPIGSTQQGALRLPLVPAARSFIRLMDDSRTLGEIVAAIAEEYDPRPAESDVWNVCRHVLEALLQYDLVLLRHATVPSFAFE